MACQTAISIPLEEEHIYIPKNAFRFGTVWNVQRHCNAEWEFHFILEGKCSVDLSQTQHQLNAGQAILIKPGEYHQAKTTTTELGHFTLGFTLPIGTIHRQLVEKTSLSPVFTTSSSLRNTIEGLWKETNANDPYADTYTDALIRCLCVELLRCLGISDTTQADKPNVTEVQLTQTIDTFFEQHFSDSCGEEELAKQLHFSRRHLVRILKKHYGMSFREKLNQTRMDYASFLLRTTDRSVGSIGAEVGYNSESSFFKAFRNSFGMTPIQYRTRKK